MIDEGHLDPEIASLLRAEASKVSVPDAVQERLLARLAVSIPGLGGPTSPGGGSSGGAAPPAGATSALSTKLGPLALTFVLGASAGAVAMRALTPAPAPSIVYVDRPVGSARSTAPSSAAVPTISAVVPTISIDALPTSPVAPRPGGARVATSASPSDDVAERQLLDGARTALARGEHDATMRALAEHARRYPSGRLEEEREALAVRTLADASRLDEARSRAVRFRARWPRSLLLPAVEAAVSQ